MSINPFAPTFEAMPKVLPIFPLSGVLLLPSGQLPLNIFEPRYLAMIDDAMAGDKMIGMLQPNEALRAKDEPFAVYQTGCAGKITEYTETPDGRYTISLKGIARFKIEKELALKSGYRRVTPSWPWFEQDVQEEGCLGVDRERMSSLLKQYFDTQGMGCDWDAVQNAPDGKLITCLAMACPVDAQEKQALLESECCKARAQKFMTMLEMAIHGRADSNPH